MFRRSRALAAVLVAAVGLTALTGSAAVWAEPDYPTWSDVQAAKGNEAQTQAKIREIEKLIEGLGAEAARFSRTAMERAEEYNQALDALDAASARSQSLENQAGAAAIRAEESRLRLAGIIAYVARSGDNTTALTLYLSGTDADDLLYRLAALDSVSSRTAELAQTAEADQRLASSLAEEARIARDQRSTLAAAARASLDTAQAEVDVAVQRTGAQDAIAAQLYDQLAALKGTTSETERAYLEGVAWEKAQAAVKNPPVSPPPLYPPPVKNPPVTPPVVTPPVVTPPVVTPPVVTPPVVTPPVTPPPVKNPPVVPPPVTPPAPSPSAVSGAIAFARAQVGDPYRLNGSGPNAWDCSGLTKASYSAVGVYIGTHSATNQFNTMNAAQRLVPFNELLAGDLLFYSNGGSLSATKYHVALYIGNGQMIEAPYPGTTVRVTTVRYGDLVPYSGRATP